MVLLRKVCWMWPRAPHPSQNSSHHEIQALQSLSTVSFPRDDHSPPKPVFIHPLILWTLNGVISPAIRMNKSDSNSFCQTCKSKVKGKRWSPQTRKSIGQPERMDLREGENNVTSGTQRSGPIRTQVPRYWQSSGWDQSMDRLDVSDLGGKRAATSVSSLVKTVSTFLRDFQVTP